jgi:glycosyltransferase involved in cell wall biosynthesis
MKHHKLWWQSSYDRGLDIVLNMWPRILAKFPDATLDITYGWDLFDKGYLDNPERQMWKEKINKMMEQKGITHHGRVGKEKLHELRSKCGIWVYPTYFQEINCIGALETQKDGLVPVVISDFALKETVWSGRKVDGDIYDPETKDKYLEALFEIMGDLSIWETESARAIDGAKKYEWDLIASEWAEYFNEKKNTVRL